MTIYTKEETHEAAEIADIACKEGIEFIGSGCPLYRNGTYPDGRIRYSAAGECSIVALQKKGEYGFDYYVMDVADRGAYRITDFQEKWLPMFDELCKKRWGDCGIPFDILLYYLLAVKFCKSDYVLHNRYCLRASMSEAAGKYRLEPIHSYGEWYGK